MSVRQIPSSIIIVARKNDRALFLGDLPPEAQPEDILNSVRGGMVESLKLTGKNYAFLQFVDHEGA